MSRRRSLCVRACAVAVEARQRHHGTRRGRRGGTRAGFRRGGRGDRGGAVPVERGPPDLGVELLVLRRRHLGVPVAGQPLLAARSAAPRADQEIVEHVGRRGVEQDGGEVLATDEVHVVDPEVDGRHLVAGCPAGALPLDHVGPPPAQAVFGGQEGAAVLECRVELGVEGAAGAQLGQAVPHLGRKAVHDRRAGAQGHVDVGRAQHAQRRAQFGHRGAVARHGRILPRPGRGGTRLNRRKGASAGARAARRRRRRRRATRCSRTRPPPFRCGR